MLGYNEKLIRDQEYITTLAYQTAAFNNSKHKPKKLEYYLDKIRRLTRKRTVNKEKVDVEKSRYIEQKIKELKGGD